MRSLSRPGSSLSVRRQGSQGRRRPASGQQTSANACRQLAVSGSAPSLLGAVPDLRFYNAGGLPMVSGMVDRPKGSKLLGALTSTFQIPLQDCNSFRRLRDATASIACKTASCSSPTQVGLLSQSPFASDCFGGDIQSPIGMDEPFMSGSPTAAAATARGGEAAVRQALIIAATRQCIRLLKRGWESVEAANATIPILVGLREDGLLWPLADVQLVTLEALIGLCADLSGATRRSRTLGPTSPGSFAAWTDGTPRSPGSPGEATGSHPASGVQLDLQRWAQQAQVFGCLSEAGLLPADGPAKVSKLLEAELRRSLRAPTPQDLKRSSKNLAEGGSWLTRALNAESECQAEGTTNGDATSMSPQRSFRLQASPESVRSIVAVGLRTATDTKDVSRDSPAAVAAREALQRLGLVDCEEFDGCETPTLLCGRQNKRSRSGPGFGQSLPELRRSPQKGLKQPPSVLESGMMQLQAAKAVLRENRLPAGSWRRPSSGVMGIRR